MNKTHTINLHVSPNTFNIVARALRDNNLNTVAIITIGDELHLEFESEEAKTAFALAYDVKTFANGNSWETLLALASIAGNSQSPTTVTHAIDNLFKDFLI